MSISGRVTVKTVAFRTRRRADLTVRNFTKRGLVVVDPRAA